MQGVPKNLYSGSLVPSQQLPYIFVTELDLGSGGSQEEQGENIPATPMVQRANPRPAHRTALSPCQLSLASARRNADAVPRVTNRK